MAHSMLHQQQANHLRRGLFATSLAVVALLIGLGVRQTGTFQLPYSFDAPESAMMVEIVDAPIIGMPPVKLSQVNRAGELSGGESGNGNRENDSVQGTAADSRNSIESDNIGWTQTKGPYGGMVGALHATPEGTLFAGAGEGGIFRSVDGGETWGGRQQRLAEISGRDVLHISRCFHIHTEGQHPLRRDKWRSFLFNRRR